MIINKKFLTRIPPSFVLFNGDIWVIKITQQSQYLLSTIHSNIGACISKIPLDSSRIFLEIDNNGILPKRTGKICF